MVPGNHNRTYSSLLAGFHRFLHTGPGRVDHTYKSKQGQTLLTILPARRQVGYVPYGNPDYPQRTACHLLIFSRGLCCYTRMLALEMMRKRPSGRR